MYSVYGKMFFACLRMEALASYPPSANLHALLSYRGLPADVPAAFLAAEGDLPRPKASPRIPQRPFEGSDGGPASGDLSLDDGDESELPPPAARGVRAATGVDSWSRLELSNFQLSALLQDAVLQGVRVWNEELGTVRLHGMQKPVLGDRAI